jgi:hypothetical protein
VTAGAGTLPAPAAGPVGATDATDAEVLDLATAAVPGAGADPVAVLALVLLAGAAMALGTHHPLRRRADRA